MKIVFKFALGAVMLVTILGSVLFAQTPAAKNIKGYFAVGRIKWSVPASFEHTFGVPHFTMGPIILCKGPLRHCEISVGARDITIELSKRRADITAELAPYPADRKKRHCSFALTARRPKFIT